MVEPTGTAIVLLVTGSLLILSALGSRLSGPTGLPIALVFLALGVLAGSEGLLGIHFENYQLSFRIGTTALALILFDGGINTSLQQMRRFWAPASLLATVGVVLTAGLVALAARTLGFDWSEAALLGAIVSSTDAAAVFAALRASNVQLKKRVGTTLEMESGLNDPMAVILTMAVTRALIGEARLGSSLLVGIPVQILVGAVLGLSVGYLGRQLLKRAKLSVAGLYPVLTVAIALVAFAVPTLLQGSGFLAVYLAAVVLGDGKLPYRPGILRVHDALAWFAQVGMFLLLGLLVFPSQLLKVVVPSVGLALIMAVIARPAAVALCLLPFRFPAKEVLFVGWVGLRGAVPIILATFPVMAGVSGAERIFNVVFFMVLVNALLPGATLRWVTRRLKLESQAPRPPSASVEITTTQDVAGEIVSFHIDRASAVAGHRLADIPFPEAAAAMLVIRNQTLIAPKGSTVLEPGDHVHVFCQPQDRPLIDLLFGRPQVD